MPAEVTLGCVHSKDVTYSFHASREALIGFDLGRSDQRHLANWIDTNCGTGGLIDARNKTMVDFLDLGTDWLLIVDTDMGFAPDSLARLMAVADAKERPIVGGLCFVQKELGPDGMNGFRCAPRATIFDWVQIEGQEHPNFVGRALYPVNQVVRCDATGAAFLLIHRSVVERIGETSGGRWFDRVPNGDTLLGEDISFCLRAGAEQFPIHVHTGVKTTHMKTLWLAEDDYWRTFPMPPATEPTAVLVPVLHRPEHARPFMQTLRASTGLATAYAIVQEGDDARAAWEAEGATIIDVTASCTTYAQKVNAGFRVTDEPWVFVAGSDVAFRAGWLDHAQHVGRSFDAGVVGTNDLGNPRVMAGEHATHFLLRRSYIDQEGGSWDPPGVVCHEGYRHWYVDDEIVTAAKQRGRWAMALGSIVEHLHPAWGKAENDDVYDLGQQSASRDRQKFQWRFERHVQAA